MKHTFAILFTITMICLSSPAAWSQCEGYITEATPPPAISGMATTDPGFTVHYWSWGELISRNGGADRPNLLDFDGGIMLLDMEWSTAEHCTVPGEVARTAVLFESLDSEGFGRWALINVGGTDGEGADIDYLQYRHPSSQARPIPVPELGDMEMTEDTITLSFSWESTPEAESLSDLEDADGAPLPSLRGWALYIINATRPTARPWDWSFAPDLESDSVSGYSTNTSARISLPRSLWHDQSICVALAPTFDGNGDASGEDPVYTSVHATYLGHPSDWIALPPEDSEEPVHIGAIRVHPIGHDSLDLEIDSPSEIQGTQYRVSLAVDDGNPYLLQSFEGGLGHYEIQIQLPSWAFRRRPHLLVEMLDGAGHLLDSRTILRASKIS